MSQVIRYGRTSLIALLLVGAVVLTVVLVRSHEAQAAGEEPTADRLAEVLIRLSLDPPALAAAGLGTDDAAGVVARVRGHLTEHAGELEMLDAARAETRRARDALERRVRSGRAEDAEIATLPALRTDAAAAEEACRSALGTLFDAAIDPLEGEARTRLVALRQHASWRLPTEFLLAERSEADWVALRGALAAERFAARRDEAVDPEAGAILDAARADGAVALARASLDANLALVTAAWQDAVQQP